MRPDSIVFVGLVVLATACAPPPPRGVCVPGSSQTCSAIGCIGTQTCSASGDAFGTCMCSGSGAGQAGGGGGSSVGGGSAAGGSAAGGSAAGGSAAGGSAAGGSAAGGSAGGGAACSVSCNGCCSGTQCVPAPNNANNGTCGVGGALCANCAAIGALCDTTLFICTAPMAGGSAAGGSAAGGSAAGGSAAGGSAAGGSAAGGSAAGGAAGGSAAGGSAAGGSAAGGSAAGGSAAGGSAAGGSAAGGSAAGGSAAGGSAAGGSAAGGSPAGGSAAGGSAAGGAAAGGSAAGGSAAGGSAGGSGTCDGCVLANGTCQPRGTPRQNNNICGSGGQLCQACLSPTPVCDNGACVAAPLRVGDACSLDAQCQASLGSFARCRLTNLSNTITYSAGHCTLTPCGTTGIDDCPLGSVCLNFPRIYGEEQAMCFVSGCGAGAPCRSGYTCFNVGSGTTSCLPSDFSNVNLSLDTTSVVGAACTLNSNCRAPTPGAPYAGGLCLAEFLTRADGGLILDAGLPQPSGNPGGYCSRTCRIDDDCTSTGTENLAEGICLSVSQTSALCFTGCSPPRGGQTNCRPGYVCERLLTSDGGVFPTGYCEGRCDVPGGACGNYTDGGARPCLSTGYCLF